MLKYAAILRLTLQPHIRESRSMELWDYFLWEILAAMRLGCWQVAGWKDFMASEGLLWFSPVKLVVNHT